jgi:hypothetical protein
VIDQTSLASHYNIDLTWSEPSFQTPNPESLKQAALDTLGLELTPPPSPSKCWLSKRKNKVSAFGGPIPRRSK